MTYCIVIKVDDRGVREARANFADAPFLHRIRPAIEKFDRAIRRLENTARTAAEASISNGD